MLYIGDGKDVIKQMHDLSQNCDLFKFYKSQDILVDMKKEFMEMAQTPSA